MRRTPRLRTAAARKTAARQHTRRSRSAVSQHLDDRRDGIPVARRDRHAEDPINRPQIADGLHVTPVLSEDEAILGRHDLHEPLALTRKTQGKGRHQPRTFREDAHETNHAGGHRLVAERLAACDVEKLLTFAHHDYGFKWESAR